jgi:hypothetical protein
MEPLFEALFFSPGHGSIDHHGHAVSRRDARSRFDDSVRDLISASINLQPPPLTLFPGMLGSFLPIFPLRLCLLPVLLLLLLHSTAAVIKSCLSAVMSVSRVSNSY